MKIIRKTASLTRRIASKYPVESSPNGGDHFRGSWTYSCDRRMYFLRKGEEYTDPPEPGVIETMKRGDRFHDYIRNTLIPMSGVRVTHQEETLYTDKPVRVVGHCDGILDMGEFRALFELKTASKWSFDQVTKFFPFDESHWTFKHYIQANRYAHFWNGMHPDEKVSEICVMVYGVNGQYNKFDRLPMIDYWLPLSKDIFREDMRRLEKIQSNIDKGVLPNAGFLESSWDCSRCPYSTKCWGNFNGSVTSKNEE